MSYTYRFIPPSAKPPFRTVIRRTRGSYSHTTEPCGPIGFRYAVFRNRSSEVWVPVHDLTEESRAAIANAERTT